VSLAGVIGDSDVQRTAAIARGTWVGIPRVNSRAIPVADPLIPESKVAKL